MGFFGRPLTSFDIGNGAALAAEIGAAVPVPPSAASIGSATLASGSRLVNPTGTVNSKTFTTIGDQITIDVSGGVSLGLYFALESIGVIAGSMSFLISWLDKTQTIVLYEEEFELNCGIGGTTIFTSIMDRILGPSVTITLQATTGITSIGSAVMEYLVQNVPVDSRRLVEQGATTAGDGLLGQFTDTLAAGISSAVHVFQLTGGYIYCRTSVAAAATAPGQFTFSWGYSVLQPFTVLTAAGTDNNFLIPATNRPLACKVTNKGTGSVGFAVSAFTNNE